MAYEMITYEENERIGLITLNRPEKRNALSLKLLREFSGCLKEIGNQDRSKVVIVKGAGEHFCAGHDINEILRQDLKDVRILFETCMELMAMIQQIPQPVIAQVRGIATAAGCQLVAACDLAIAEEGALFATPGVKIGLFCSTPMVPVYRAVGRKRALEMLLTGRFVSAREAREFGLINRVVALKDLEQESLGLALEIAAYSLETIGIGKRGFYRQIDMTEGQAYEFAKELISSNAMMDDAVEGMSAFIEKRSPRWRGEES